MTAPDHRSTAAGLLRASLAVLLVVAGLGTSAQASTPVTGQGRISAFEDTDGGVRLVYSGGNLPPDAGLDVDEVEVTFVPDDGEPVQLEATAESAGTVDRRIVLALDVSGSLGDAGIQAVREAATSFVEQAPENAEIGLVTFGRPAEVVLEPTDDRELLLASIQELDEDGDTALYDAVVLAADLLDGEGNELILLMTDGEDQASTAGSIGSEDTLDEASAAVATSGATLTAVAFGEALQGPLQQLATAGGTQQVIPADDPAALTEAFDAVVQDITDEVVVDLAVPEDLRGRPGSLTVTAPAGDVLTSATRVGRLGQSPEPPPAPPSEPAPEPTPSEQVVAGPLPPAQAAALLPGPVLWLAVGSLFLALLLAAGVLAGLATERNGPAATRQRNLQAYSLRGRPPAPQERETAPTRLGDNAVARSAVELAGRVVDRRGLADDLGRRLEAAGVPLRAAEWFVLHIASVIAVSGLLLLLSQGEPLAMVLGAVIGFVIPQMTLSLRRTRRERAFLMVLPDTLGLMASGLRAGYSMPQAMDSVAREGQEPIRSEFNRALVEARLGVPPEEAMDGIADRMDSKDFRWVVMAIRIQREVGGNLAELLDTVAVTLRERSRLRRQVDVLSAEGRLSAWIIGALPIVFALYLSLSQPEYLRVLYTNELGVAVGILSLVVFGLGVLGLRWAIKVDV